MDIDGWLRGIGLAQYAGIFRADDIDGGLLGRLANDDLKDIGVASFGHRKKILEAIAALAAATDVATPIPAAAAVPKPPNGADRRHLAVLFCDLIGSTSLSAALDAAAVAEMAGMWRKSSATGSWRCSDTRSRRKTTPSAPFALRS